MVTENDIVQSDRPITGTEQTSNKNCRGMLVCGQIIAMSLGNYSIFYTIGNMCADPLKCMVEVITEPGKPDLGN